MDGIKRCEMFRAIRKRLCENNGIPFLEEGCPTPNKRCIGTCPECDHWLDRINAHIELKRWKGESIDYSGIKEIYESFLDNEEILIEDLPIDTNPDDDEPLMGCLKADD